MSWLLTGDAGLGPREVLEWPMVKDPAHPILACVAYYVIVWVLTWIMKRPGQEPLQLKLYSQVHNALMVVMSLYMGLEYIRCFFYYGLKLTGNNIRSDDDYIPLARIQWIFYLSKIPEWNDTFIMILKKNFRQVSILHLYHHGSIFLFSYTSMRHCPGGDSWLAAVINSWVHVVMYSYYFCAPLARDPNAPKWVKAVTSVKKYITMMQLIQFLIVFTRDSYMLYCTYILGYTLSNAPIYMVLTEWLYMISMVALFMNFYLNTYRSSPRPDGATVEKKEKVIKQT